MGFMMLNGWTHRNHDNIIPWDKTLTVTLKPSNQNKVLPILLGKDTAVMILTRFNKIAT